MKNTKKKILKGTLSITLVLLLLVGAAIGCFAEDSATSAEESYALTDDVPTDTDSLPVTDIEGADTNKEIGGGFFEKLYGATVDYLGEILCALAFAGSMVLAFAYKKGLLPLLSRAVNTLGSTVGRIKEDTESYAKESGSRLRELTEKLSSAEGVITGFGETLSRLEGELSELRGADADKKRYEAILASQVELLYDIFMSSALPEYQKEAVAKRIASMRELTESAEDRAV